jgi:hypothetical protein
VADVIDHARRDGLELRECAASKGVPPTRCRSHAWASAPSRSCRTSRASRARRTESTADRSPGGAYSPRRAQSRPTSPATCGGRGARGRMRAWSTRRSRARRRGVGRVALAHLRFIARSNLVGCCTGRALGLAPFKVLST